MVTQREIFIEEAKYCFDTSSIIQLRQFYPADVFEQLHQKMTPLFKSGKICMLNIVFDELASKEKELHDLLKSIIPKSRQPLYEENIKVTQEIIQKYYDAKGKTHELKADPHVIAYAKIEEITVVTEEYATSETRIPSICEKESINCFHFIDFLRKENIKL